MKTDSRKYFAGGIATALLLLAVIYISSYKYISGLPNAPDNSSISETINDQIAAARNKALFFPTSDNIGKLGMVFHSAGLYNEAKQSYSLASEKNKKDWRWQYYLGSLNLEKGEPVEALKDFLRVIELDSGNVMASYYAGDICRGLNRNEDAEKYFVKVSEINYPVNEKIKSGEEYSFPIRIYALFNLGRIKYADGKYDEAEKIMKQIISEQVTFGSAYRLLGNVYQQKGDSVRAKKYSIRAKDYADYMPPADLMADELMMISRSDVYLLKGIDMAVASRNLDKAVEICDHSLKYLPDNKFLLSKAIKIYIESGKENRAFSLVEKHLSLFADDFKELIGIADLFMNNENKKIGILYFSAAKKLEPYNPALSILLRRWNFVNEAYALMKEQLVKNPTDAELISNAAIISMGKNEKDSALMYIEKLRNVSPSNPEINRNIGFMAYQENNPAAAVKYWNEVLKSDPKDINTIRNLNKIYRQKENWKESSELLKHSLNFNPNHPILLEEYGKLLVFCPDPEITNIAEGCEYLERAWYSFYSSYEIRLSAGKDLAAAYAMRGDKKTALAFMTKTLELAKEANLNEYQVYFDGIKKKYKLD